MIGSMQYIAFVLLIVYSVAEGKKCSDLSCEGNNCCESIRNGAECCPSSSICDSELGCISNGEKLSDPQSAFKKCPFPTKTCFSFLFFHVCCPHPMGVCCSDIRYCCPRKHECDVPNKRCIYRGDADLRIPYSKGARKCGNTFCPEEDECCQDSDGHSTCCKKFSQMNVFH